MNELKFIANIVKKQSTLIVDRSYAILDEMSLPRSTIKLIDSAHDVSGNKIYNCQSIWWNDDQLYDEYFDVFYNKLIP